MSPAAGAPTAANEDEVRTAFLFQLAQYVHWPADSNRPANAPLRFCIVGHDRLTTTLEATVKGKAIQGRPIVVRRMVSVEEAEECDLAFLAYQSGKQVKAALRSWSYPPVLLVGELEGFAELGGMVNLLIQGGRVSFEINVGAAERARLEMRSQLLRFARIVTAGGEKGTGKR